MSFFNELKRRNVFKVAAAYIIVGWLIMQVGDTLAPALHLPEWINSALAFFLILGFPLALFFAWAFEMTPEGIMKQKDIDKDGSITHLTGQKLNHIIIGLLVLAVGYFAFDKFVLDPQRDAELLSQAQREAAEPAASSDAQDRIPDKNSIAVLPFANRSNREEDLFFTDGIHDDLLTQLAKVDDLKVISRTSVMEYRNSTRKIPEIARELGVATILEGGIQRAGERIRINAQLIDVETDEHLWAETFDRELTVENIFEIQSEISRQIVAAVRGELSPEEKASLAQLPTQNLDAYEAYMHAKAAISESTYSADKFLLAQEWAEKAVELDPEFKWAWALLLETHAQAIWIGYDATSERLEAAKLALEKTTAGDPKSVEAQAALGEYLYRIEADYFNALEAFKKALTLRPGSARFMYSIATTQRRIGRFDESVASYEKALQLDPANAWAVSDYLLTLLFNAEYEKGIQQAEKAIQRFPQADILKSHLAFMHIHWKGDLSTARTLLNEMSPSAGFEYVTLATRLPLYERNYEEALATWDKPEVIRFSEYGSNPGGWRARVLGEIQHLLGNEKAKTRILREFISYESARSPRTPKGRAHQLINVGLAHALIDEPEKALELMHQSRELIESVADAMAAPSIDGHAARILALVGQRGLALKEIERLIDTPASRLTRWSLTLDPRWDFFRDDERFNDLVRPLNGPESGK